MNADKFETELGLHEFGRRRKPVLKPDWKLYLLIFLVGIAATYIASQITSAFVLL